MGMLKIEKEHWSDLESWVHGHVRLFKNRGNPLRTISTANDFGFSSSKWRRFYKFTNKGRSRFTLAVYCITAYQSEKMLYGEVYAPSELLFIVVELAEQASDGHPKALPIYGKTEYWRWRKTFQSEVLQASWKIQSKQLYGKSSVHHEEDDDRDDGAFEDEGEMKFGGANINK